MKKRNIRENYNMFLNHNNINQLFNSNNRVNRVNKKQSRQYIHNRIIMILNILIIRMVKKNLAIINSIKILTLPKELKAIVKIV